MTIEAEPAVLFDGALEPFTSRIWFIDVDAVQVWLHGLPGRARFDHLTGPPDGLLGRLEPWAMPSWKELIVGTAGR